MRSAFVAVLVPLLLAGAACKAEPPAELYVSKTGFRAVPLPRPEEPKATYTLLDTWVESPDHIITISKRVGPAGTSYTRRRVDCRRARLMTMGSGETVKAMMQERPDPHESDMIGGSSATLTSVTACQILGR